MVRVVLRGSQFNIRRRATPDIFVWTGGYFRRVG